MIIQRLCVGMLIAGALTVTAGAGELHVEVRRFPAAPGKAVPAPQVVGEAATVAQVGPGRWKYSVEKQVFGTLTVLPGKDDLASYDAKPLLMKLPFNVTRPIGVQLVSTKKEPVSANVALNLYGTAVQKQSEEFLWQFYQRAQLQAVARLAEIEAGRPVNHSDIRVFFKALEVVRELGRQRYLGISSDIKGVKEYLVGIVSEPSMTDLIKNALGPNAKHLPVLIEEISDLEADQFIAVWRQIRAHAVKSPSAQGEACNWYRLLDATLNEMDDGRARRILAKDNLGALLSGALNDCAAKSAIVELRTNGTVSVDTKEEVQRRLAEITRAAATVKAAPFEQVLRRQQRELRQVLR